MDTSTTFKVDCRNCGQQLSQNDTICPSCGSTNRNFFITLQETQTTQDSLRLRQKDSNGFEKITFMSRNKISGLTKQKTRETLIYDKTDSNFTYKNHHVEETDKEGKTDIVHHEVKKFPAKNRPK
jgi:hypothetical protein